MVEFFQPIRVGGQVSVGIFFTTLNPNPTLTQPINTIFHPYIYIYTQKKSGKKKVHFLLFQADEFGLGELTLLTRPVWLQAKIFLVWAGCVTHPNRPKIDFQFQFPS